MGHQIPDFTAFGETLDESIPRGLPAVFANDRLHPVDLLVEAMLFAERLIGVKISSGRIPAAAVAVLGSQFNVDQIVFQAEYV